MRNSAPYHITVKTRKWKSVVSQMKEISVNGWERHYKYTFK